MPLFRTESGEQTHRPKPAPISNSERSLLMPFKTVEHGSLLHHILGARLRISTLTVLYCMYQRKMSSHVQCRGRGCSSRSIN